MQKLEEVERKREKILQQKQAKIKEQIEIRALLFKDRLKNEVEVKDQKRTMRIIQTEKKHEDNIEKTKIKQNELNQRKRQISLEIRNRNYSKTKIIEKWRRQRTKKIQQKLKSSNVSCV